MKTNISWRNNTIWFSDLPKKSISHLNFTDRKIVLPETHLRTYAFLWHYRSKTQDLKELPENAETVYLEVNLGNLKSISGINRLKALKRLELHHCTKFESDSGISTLAQSLEWLHINRCKKFIFSSELLSLKNLRVLCLNSIAPIKNLNFLRHFPKLLDFRFVDTNILSGDLSPLLNHSSLVHVGFLNKKHYSHKDSEIMDFFKEREAASRVVVPKGKYETFYYKDMA